MTATTTTRAATGALQIPVRPRSWPVRLAWAAVAVAIVAAFWDLGIEWSKLASLPSDLAHYTRLMFSDPDWSKLPEALYQTWRSVAMAWTGALLGVVLSTLLGIPAAQGVGPLWVRLPLRWVFAVIRAVPEVVIAIIILTVTGLTPFTGALALAIGGIGTHAKWTYETIESVPQGTSEAVRASGGNVLEVARWGLWPAASPELMSLGLYRFEINVRTSAILGLIGVGGIGDMLTGYTQYREWDTVGVLIIVVIVVTMSIDAVSGRIRRRIMEGAKARDLDRSA
ncbi:phosphonate ABC transporter, permease protein PhnE [Demequina zhanjiangensis]|uniref:Phosphonate ABC transporter, permease protein PhnE n=1 Tax=Demequina zhanjiangensis TaxID=3051659 RepID=A0ABT8G038_9MICO|nr:phosphonate ABC transporter, permease protein PhnE [Demequina sp. SYSU T00b26]MDN4472516.1 phosphonate ABC transporter, permease protein PhnE [Demequina sp. SYSU T00b26]